MPSVLNVDTLVAANGTDPVKLTKQSAAKAWANIRQDGSSLNRSFNCTSISDDATGVRTISFVNSFIDADHAPVLGHRPGPLNSGTSNQRNSHVETVSAGNVKLVCSYTGTNGVIIFYDVNHQFSSNGDLA